MFFQQKKRTSWCPDLPTGRQAKLFDEKVLVEGELPESTTIKTYQMCRFLLLWT
jgi:hypothetical protein